MERGDFDRDLAAWLDGELPAERAARMQASADASPELAKRAEMERAFDTRMKRALVSDANGADAVRAILAKARAEQAPAGRLLALPRGALKIAAAMLLVVTGGLWWFCIPPFECSYMQALEVASHDAAAVPGQKADDLAKRFGLPADVDGAKPAPPVAATSLDFFAWHVEGVRLDYVRPDGSAFHVVVCDSPGAKPSMRRRTERDGQTWWIADVRGLTVVAFERPRAPDEICAVTGLAGGDSVFAAAKAMRAAMR